MLCLFFGKLFAKSKEEYEWLQQSTFNFPGKEELKRMFEEAGFINVRVRSFTGALLQCTLAIKKKIIPKVINVAKLKMNNEIKKVEQRLEKAIKSKDSVLEQASLHLLSSGGKNPTAFVILSSQFGKDEQTSEQTYQVAVALELIHMATLFMMTLLIKATSVEAS